MSCSVCHGSTFAPDLGDCPRCVSGGVVIDPSLSAMDLALSDKGMEYAEYQRWLAGLSARYWQIGIDFGKSCATYWCNVEGGVTTINPPRLTDEPRVFDRMLSGDEIRKFYKDIAKPEIVTVDAFWDASKVIGKAKVFVDGKEVGWASGIAWADCTTVRVNDRLTGAGVPGRAISPLIPHNPAPIRGTFKKVRFNREAFSDLDVNQLQRETRHGTRTLAERYEQALWDGTKIL